MEIIYYRGLKKVYDNDILISRDCSKCLEHKRYEDFPKTKSKSYKDGVLGKCKICTNGYFKKYSKENEKSLKEYREDYYKDNKEKVDEKNKSYAIKNKESIKEYNKKWRDKNKEKIKERTDKWKEENRKKLNEYKKVHTSNRRSLIELSNKMTLEQWNEILYHFEGRCPLTDSLNITIEHFIPISKNGETSIFNCYPIQDSLNYSKSNKNPFLWANEKIQEGVFSKERWDILIIYLSNKNNMTTEQYEDYVLTHFESEVV